MHTLLTTFLTLTLLVFGTTEGWGAQPDERQYCLSGTQHSHYAIEGKCSDSYEAGDYQAALLEWTPLAEQGNGYAQHNMGQIYRRGHGVSQDDTTAVKWYTLAAEQGNATAQYNLGWMYDNGKGVLQDYKTAVHWYMLSAKQGNDRAQNYLGFMYEHGQGIVQDYGEAVEWYLMAAEQGNVFAQYHLGVMYRDFLKDNVLAHMWLNIATFQGNKAAEEDRDHILERMTFSQVDEAKRLARECVANNYKNC